MNDRQRVFLVVALGLAIAVIVHTWDTAISNNSVGGWFAYAPNTSPIFSTEDEGAIWRRGAMWFAGILVWTLASFLILRTGSRDET